jgi:hypothetical protein
LLLFLLKLPSGRKKAAAAAMTFHFLLIFNILIKENPVSYAAPCRLWFRATWHQGVSFFNPCNDYETSLFAYERQRRHGCCFVVVVAAAGPCQL